jgi:transposase
MKRRGRKAQPIILTSEQRIELERLARRKRDARGPAFRARVVLMLAQGAIGREIQQKLRTSHQTVCAIRKRFLRGGVEALFDEPRPGAPRKISDEQIEHVIVATLERRPQGATHWSTRMMAEKLGFSQSAISRIWRAFGLKPHRSSTYTLSRDPLFVEKVRDVVGLYMSPPDRAVVLSVDEKSQIQALNRTQPILPLRPGTAERRTPDYERHGTTSLFAALDVKTGKVIGRCYPRHRAREFRQFLDLVDAGVPAQQQVHLILDNYATHKSPTIRRWLLKNPRFHLHFIPTHSSWLNLVERWFALLTQRQIKRGAHTSVAQLQGAIEQFLAVSNQAPRPFVWTKTADEILDKVARYAGETVRAHTCHFIKNSMTQGTSSWLTRRISARDCLSMGRQCSGKCSRLENSQHSSRKLASSSLVRMSFSSEPLRSAQVGAG